MRALLPFLGILSAASALHFYFDGSTLKCFFEDLPKDTLVVGNYSAEEYIEHASAWQQNADIGIYIFVDVRRRPRLLTPAPGLPVGADLGRL